MEVEWIAFPIVLVVYLALYLVRRWKFNRLRRMLPLETPEALQQFMNAMHKQPVLGVFLTGIATGVGGLALLIFLINMQMQDREWVWTAYGPTIIVYPLGIWLILILAGLPLDRAVRQTSWPPRVQLTYIIGFRLFYYSTLFGLLGATELWRQGLPKVIAEKGWRLASMIVLMFSYLALRWMICVLGLNLMGLAHCKDPALAKMVAELCAAAGVRVPKLWRLPERGGKVTLGAVIGRNLILSDYLRQELSAEELRALVAHEIGHIAGRDLRRRSLIMSVLAIGGMVSVCLLPRGLVKDWMKAFPPLIMIVPLFPLLLGSHLVLRRYRDEELKADRLGARLIGSATVMARTLEKLHALAYLPADFQKEKWMTHPSLVHRLKALEEATLEVNSV